MSNAFEKSRTSRSTCDLLSSDLALVFLFQLVDWTTAILMLLCHRNNKVITAYDILVLIYCNRDSVSSVLSEKAVFSD